MAIETKTLVASRVKIAGGMMDIIGSPEHGRIAHYVKGSLYIYDTPFLSGIMRFVRENVPNAQHYRHDSENTKFGNIIHHVSMKRVNLRELVRDISMDYLGYAPDTEQTLERVVSSYILTDDDMRSNAKLELPGQVIHKQLFTYSDSSRDLRSSFGYTVNSNAIVTGVGYDPRIASRHQSSRLQFWMDSLEDYRATGTGERFKQEDAVSFACKIAGISIGSYVISPSSSNIKEIEVSNEAFFKFTEYLHAYSMTDTLSPYPITTNKDGNYSIARQIVLHD